MPHDHRGQLHAGSIGLFDDEEELDATECRNIGRAIIRERKYAKKAAKAEEKRLSQERGEGFLHRIKDFFTSKEKKTGGVERTEEHVYDELRQEFYEDGNTKDDSEGEDVAGRMYDMIDVDQELDSPFYEELGLVRIKSKNGLDAQVVSKSRIRT